MEAIADELWKNNVNIDKKILTDHINDVLDRHGKSYDEMAERLGPEELLSVFCRNECEQFRSSYDLFDIGLFDGYS